jgi:putative membrane protein
MTLFVVAVAVLVAAQLFPGVRVQRRSTVVVVATVFGVLNLLFAWLLRAVLAAALFPIAVLSFGLIYFFLGLFVNALLLFLTDKLVDGFEIRTFRALLGTAVLVSASNWLLNHLW